MTMETLEPKPRFIRVSVVAWGPALLLGICDFHGTGRCDPEALQGVFSHTCLRVTLKLHKGDVMFPWDEPHLFKPRKSVEDQTKTIVTQMMIKKISHNDLMFNIKIKADMDSLVEQH